MSSYDDSLKRIEQQRKRQEEELKRIRDNQRKERELNEQSRKGRPTDERPTKDD
ncbi:hypothetical protein [Maribellus sediminis]|uniref:hypothetical protein n=1 Tax=Maribellus sediminis TaxID=2696285 RepID=UPI001431AB98|nr:hypothetical protein [Maribellus sediminis]